MRNSEGGEGGGRGAEYVAVSTLYHHILSYSSGGLALFLLVNKVGCATIGGRGSVGLKNVIFWSILL